MKTLKELCVVRDSVFDSSRRDTVLDLTDLIDQRIDADEFFKTNYVTDGMHTLLDQGFRRFAGQSSQSTFLLTQAMGGGKTHNMIALGLLAQHPELREEVMGEAFADLGPVRVVAFTGRESDAPLGIWGAIADQLGQKDQFNPYYSPLAAPGQTAWVELLQGEPLLILLDELPPYFENARAKEIGNSDLATVTTTALSNLLVAVNRLENVAVVISDLRATYGEGSQQIGAALRNLENEVHRGALPLDPVRHNTAEIYHILRKRLFKDMPDKDEIRAVARAYSQAVKDAQQMDVTSASPEEYERQLMEAYPFHFSIRDLYSRFRENPGFQQTRDLIRLMRTVVAHMYDTGRAEQAYLIHPYDVDLNHKDTLVQVSQINPKLENAISHDIADNGGSVAETIDANRDGRDAQDTGTLLLMASLSNVPGALRGLTRSEIIGYLCAPGRDISQLEKNVLRPYFTSGAWYLHSDADGRLLFKDVQNINARLQTMADSYVGSAQPMRELREFLAGLFEPSLKDVYQRVQALPGLDEIEVDPGRLTLVISAPQPGGGVGDEMKAFYEDMDYQNRILFLTGQRGTLEHLLEKAARLRAIRQILKEMQQDNVPSHDPQYTEAQELEDEIRLQLLSAARETFTTLLFPHFDGKLRSADFVMNFTDNNYNGEAQIRQTLDDKGKFTADIESDTFRQKLETRLFTQKEMIWSEVERRAAATPEWQWHKPDALKRLKERMVHEDKWRESGSYVEKPPFPPPATNVRVMTVQRDPGTGEALLRLTPVHGDTIHYEVGGVATEASSRVDDFKAFETDALRVSFLCVDSNGEHETGPPVTWENKITIQSRVFQSGQKKMIELRVAPPGPEIRYTTDGSNPVYNGGVYNGPFAVPPGAQVVLAVASKDGISSEQHRRDIDWEDTGVTVDPAKPATWKRNHKLTTTQETYDFLDRMQALGARAGGLRIGVEGDQWVDLSFSREVILEGERIKDAVEYVRGFFDGGEVTLVADVLQFPHGQALLEWVEQVKTELQPDEVQ